MMFAQLQDKTARKGTGRWPLSLPLIRWSQHRKDVWTLADALQDVVVFGQKGSGKTSASGRLFARKFLQAGMGGIVLCAQPEEANNWRGYLKEANRTRDGRFFTLTGDLRFNPIAWQAHKSGGADFAQNVVKLLFDVSSIRRAGKETPELPFWGEQRKLLLSNCVQLLMTCGDAVTLKGIYRLIQDTPQIAQQAEDRFWQKQSYTYDRIQHAADVAGDRPDVPGLRTFFLQEWPKHAPKTRGTIESDLNGLLHPLTRGRLAELFGTSTNVSPDDMESGKVIVVDVPMEYEEIAQYAALLWLQSVYRMAKRRKWDPPYTRPLFVFIDETQYYVTKADDRFQSTSRHHGFSVVRLTQSLPGLRAAIGLQDDTDALLAHCCTRIYHLNTCAITNKWAAESIGQALRANQSVSARQGGEDRPNASFAEAHDLSCRSEEFLDLKSGSKRYRGIVEGIVSQAGRTFLGGKRWIISSYRQSRK